MTEKITERMKLEKLTAIKMENTNTNPYDTPAERRKYGNLAVDAMVWLTTKENKNELSSKELQNTNQDTGKTKRG